MDHGEILCPKTANLTPSLVTEPVITRPFELTTEVMLIGRRVEDGRSIKLVAVGGSIELRLDNQPDEFLVVVHPQETKIKSTYPFAEHVWHSVYCRVQGDGRVTASLNGSAPLTTEWQAAFPARVELECQRSGAWFRNLVVRYL